MPYARSYLVFGNSGVRQFPNSIFLRISHSYGWLKDSQLNVFHLLYSRFHTFEAHDHNFVIPSSINLLWNLDTLIIRCRREDLIAPTEIWKMYKLRHLEFELETLLLPDLPMADNDVIIMLNLEVLKGMKK